MDAETKKRFDSLNQEFDMKIVELDKIQDDPKAPRYHKLYWRCKDILSETNLILMEDIVNNFKSFK